LNDVIGGKTTYEKAVQSGAIQVSGDQAAAADLFSLMDTFDPWFNIVTP
jgi:alkyl sulfatase BDS1-like metallo-beta-lactamase superfamily hydrolase